LKNPETYEMGNQLRIINVAQNTTALPADGRSGISMASSPSIIDLDMGQGAQYSIIECSYLNRAVHSTTWPRYLGPKENGQFK